MHNASTPQPKKVGYGRNDLSRIVQQMRRDEEEFTARNGAVFEYEDKDGNRKTHAEFSRSNLQFTEDLGHAERRIWRALEAMEIDACQVRRIYTELEPCIKPNNCSLFIKQNFPKAVVTYSSEYGSEEASNIPEQQQAASLRLKALGEEHGIAEFTEAMVPLDHADGHAFASIAVGEGLGKAYYRGPYEGGADFLRITQGMGSKGRYVLFGKSFVTALRTHIAAHPKNRWLARLRPSIT